MNESPSRRMRNVSKESIDRLSVANILRDRLLENSDTLSKLGVLGVVAFGSAVEGTAHENSDLDIGILIDKKTYPTLEVYATVGEKLEDYLFNTIFQGLPMPVSRYVAKDARRRDFVHFVVKRVEDPQKLPDGLENSVSLWEKKFNARERLFSWARSFFK